MADVARDQLDRDITRAVRSRQMLLHLAVVVSERPRTHIERGGYPDDALAALEHGAELAGREQENLEHVRALYDEAVRGG